MAEFERMVPRLHELGPDEPRLLAEPALDGEVIPPGSASWLDFDTEEPDLCSKLTKRQELLLAIAGIVLIAWITGGLIYLAGVAMGVTS